MIGLLGSCGPVYSRATLLAVATLLLGMWDTNMSTNPLAAPNTRLHTYGIQGVGGRGGGGQQARTSMQRGRLECCAT